MNFRVSPFTNAVRAPQKTGLALIAAALLAAGLTAGVAPASAGQDPGPQACTASTQSSGVKGADSGSAKINRMGFIWTGLDASVQAGTDGTAVVKVAQQTFTNGQLNIVLPPNHGGPTWLGEEDLKLNVQFQCNQSPSAKAAAIAIAISNAADVKHRYDVRINGDEVIISRPRLL